MLTFSAPSVYEALELVMKYYPDNFTDEAKVEIDTLFDHCLEGLSDDSEKFLSTLFIKSIKRYIGDTSVKEHIYLKKYEMPQIKLFDILIKEFPFVKIGHEITNSLIISLLNTMDEAVIIDVGIGMGTQIKNLLSKHEQIDRIKKLTIIGIEPFGDALEKAEMEIKRDYSNLRFAVNFISINEFIENISIDQVKFLISKESAANIIINASLALHHIQSLDDRHQVIKKMRQLNPKAFILTEPNVDHYEPDFYRRFQNCFSHFYGVFKVIDRLDIDIIDKNALKLFFGREVEDIIGKHDNERFEKHEPAFRWIERLKNNDFTINQEYFRHPITTKHGINIQQLPQGFLGFSYGSEIILSIIYAKS